MRKLFLSSILTLFVSTVSPTTWAQLEVPPHWNFKKMRTAHFDIIYNTEQQDLGLLYAEKLEKAHLLLGNYFSVLPERTVVIINDKTDLTNGYATRVPYPHIMAYPVLPGPQESLGDTGDWAFELLAHEYTHILTFEPATGAIRIVRGIFGNIISANLLLPRWWKEGVAVQMETRLGNFGRLRSIYQDSAIRAFSLDEKLFQFPLPEINEFLPTWPEGARPYLFGSVIWSQMVADKGDKVVDNLNLRHSARVPFFVEEPARENFGRTYEEEYKVAIKDTEARAQNQINFLNQVKPTPFQVLDLKSQYASAPTISPDGKHMVVITVSETDSRDLKILKRSAQNNFINGEEFKTIEDMQENRALPTVFDGPPSGSIQRVSWFHDSTKIVYDKVDVTNRIERYSDLYTYDLKTKKTEALSHGLRAREPSVSPDDKQIVFVKLSGAKTQLALMKMNAEKTVEMIYSPEIQSRISYPIFINEKEILFSMRQPSGSEFLYKINLDDRKPLPVLTDFPNARFAVLHKDSLFFTSSKNGTHNIYRTDLKLKTAQPVSHTLTALFSFTLDPQTDDIYTTYMSSGGPHVQEFNKADWLQTPKQLPVITHLFGDRYPEQLPTLTTENDKKLNYEVTDYSAAGYLWPQYWIPFIASSTSNNGVVLQAMTSGFDPLKKHTYNIMGSWDTGLNRGSVQGTYLNQQTSLPVLLSLYQLNSYLGSVDNRITDTGSSLGVLPDTFRLSRYSNLLLGWQYFERKLNGSEIKRMGPYMTVSYSDYTKAGTQVSPESGLGGYLGAANFIEQEGYLAHSQFTFGGTTYISKFLPERNALMIKLSGVYTPEKISSVYGVQTDSLVSTPDSARPDYVMRGYRTGQFFGRNLVNSNIEYRFPLRDIYKGSGTDPIFLSRVVGALVSDAVALEGFFFNSKLNSFEATTLQRTFVSYGAEARVETTIGYTFPINFVFGYYFAPNAVDGGEGSVGTALQIGGF